jgi:hypothetical protein
MQCGVYILISFATMGLFVSEENEYQGQKVIENPKQRISNMYVLF